MDAFDPTDDEDEDEDWVCGAYAPGSGLPREIYLEAVPIWTGKPHPDIFAELGGEYACGFAWGFESAIVMSCLKPEWAQAFYVALREHYRATHSEEEMEDWERQAEETARAIPMQRP
ncbi:MAG TPA: hypothetical protein VFP63_00255 [Dehalococcoidia bacterium]|nr:hypothetical protein [Dehalococcoidia bacterium]